jgi:predicted small lipoprotein YifL
MLRLPARHSRRVVARLAVAVACAGVLAGCGVKGPLVPAPRAAAKRPPPATTDPQIPSATPNDPQRPPAP